ncbi:hypothetical protein SIN8267_01389 [Sinobacterium norvegicum]|uniref:VOC domain-containing protein n=1 Tax=Sinobacterium norvegicum TaxID=1641715 RepID=A0ABM9AED1_9GAMM|nr:VOC family protein [Sinobacterium norvegicum]CAH0991287.1 hypothetical protein SIN8267_01389 [Sinobacterium norvegicum]
MHIHHQINYVEFPGCDLEATQAFFEAVFNFAFEHYGDDYIAFADRGLDGGFYRAPMSSKADNGSALLVFYSQDLTTTLTAVEDCGGTIKKTIFAFPGGHRFHFIEPSGNEFAVWSDCYHERHPQD